MQCISTLHTKNRVSKFVADHDSLLTQRRYVYVKEKILRQYSFDTTYFELLLSQQKLGTFLGNKGIQKLKFSKIVKNEKCVSKMIFFNENCRGSKVVQKIFARNLLIYRCLHCFRRLSWPATTLDTLTKKENGRKSSILL